MNSLRLPAVSVLLATLFASPLCRAAEPSPLYVDCRGDRTTAPTVILESGAFGTSADWARVLDDLAVGGRVCAYDRAGVGASPPRTGGESVTAIATELAALLDSLGETGPVILVGHSNGALYIETFAAMWPQRVAGLVYINGVTSDDLNDPTLMGYLKQERFIANLVAFVGDIGLAPLIAPAVVKAEDLPPDAARRKIDFLTQPARLHVARDEDRGVIPGLSTAQNLGGSPPQIPTVVLVGQTYPDVFSSKAWRAAETASAERATTHWILQANGATHVSPLSRDRAWVVAAVDWLRSLPGADIGH